MLNIYMPTLLEHNYLIFYKYANRSGDEKKHALRLLNEKANENDPQALYVLACLELHLEKKNHYYILNPVLNQRAIGRGIHNFFNSLEHYSDHKKIQSAVDTLKLCAVYFPEAAFLLGEIYRQGLFNQKINLTKALSYHRNAAKREHPGSLFRLSLMCFMGSGVPINMKTGYAYLKKAASKNHIGALLWQHHIETMSLIVGWPGDLNTAKIALIKAILAMSPIYATENVITNFTMPYDMKNEKGRQFIGINFSEDLACLALLQDPAHKLSGQDILYRLSLKDGFLMDAIQSVFQSRKLPGLAFDKMTLDETIKFLTPFFAQADFLNKIYSVLENNTEEKEENIFRINI
ncbi:MAG: hypothetical protein SFW66_02335 [Gammaproteobacteria bacterium]|nr:hypothetical protein [Gammaproteobacteria bacterium]